MRVDSYVARLCTGPAGIHMFAAAAAAGPVPRWALPGAAGVCVAAGWWLFAAAVLRQTTHGLLPPPDPSWYLPGTLATLAGFMAALAPFHLFDASPSSFGAGFAIGGGGGGPLACARCYVFAAFTLSLAAVLAGIALVLSMQSLADAAGLSAADAAAFTFPEAGPALTTAAAASGPSWQDVNASLADGGGGAASNAWSVIARPRVSTWPGVAAATQATLILAGTLLWIAARLPGSEDD